MPGQRKAVATTRVGGQETSIELTVPPFAGVVRVGGAKRAPSFVLPDARLALVPPPFDAEGLRVTYALVPEDARGVAHAPVEMVLVEHGDGDGGDGGGGMSGGSGGSGGGGGGDGSSDGGSDGGGGVGGGGRAVFEVGDGVDVRVPVFLRQEGSAFRLVFVIAPLHAPAVVVGTAPFVLRRAAASSARLDSPSPALASASHAPAWVRIASLELLGARHSDHAPPAPHLHARARARRPGPQLPDTSPHDAPSPRLPLASPISGWAALDDDVASLISFDRSSARRELRPRTLLFAHDHDADHAGTRSSTPPTHTTSPRTLPHSSTSPRPHLATPPSPSRPAASRPPRPPPPTSSHSSFTSGFALGLLCGSLTAIFLLTFRR